MAEKMDEFTKAYLETALWSSIDSSTGNNLDDEFTVNDLSPETREKMVDDCGEFQSKYGEYIGSKSRRAGHDFWLTRNGHGAGFWDGDWPKKSADILTDAAHAYGEFDLYVGDDGKIHGSPL